MHLINMCDKLDLKSVDKRIRAQFIQQRTLLTPSIQQPKMGKIL